MSLADRLIHFIDIPSSRIALFLDCHSKSSIKEKTDRALSSYRRSYSDYRSVTFEDLLFSLRQIAESQTIHWAAGGKGVVCFPLLVA
jgi:hypothetical protein